MDRRSTRISRKQHDFRPHVHSKFTILMIIYPPGLADARSASSRQRVWDGPEVPVVCVKLCKKDWRGACPAGGSPRSAAEAGSCPRGACGGVRECRGTSRDSLHVVLESVGGPRMGGPQADQPRGEARGRAYHRSAPRSSTACLGAPRPVSSRPNSSPAPRLGPAVSVTPIRSD